MGVKILNWPYHFELLQRTLQTYCHVLCKIKQGRSEGFDTSDRSNDLVWPAWPWNWMNDLEKQLGTSSVLLKALCLISQVSVYWNWSCYLEMQKLGSNWWFFGPFVLEFGWMILKNNKAPLLWPLKICAPFHSNLRIETTVIYHPEMLKSESNWRFFFPYDPIGWMTLEKKNKAPLLCHFKFYASFHSHLWIQIGVLDWKCPNWGKICFHLCNLDLWPWPFAWTSLLSRVITHENFMMIRLEKHCVTDRHKVWQRQTDRTVHRAAWSQVNMIGPPGTSY